jgi:hypothetical protein
VATYIKLVHKTCRSLRWAAGFAHSPDLVERTLDCGHADYAVMGSLHGRMLVVPPFDAAGYRHRLDELQKRCSAPGVGSFYYGGSSSDRQHGSRLDPDLEVQSVMVNLTM